MARPTQVGVRPHVSFSGCVYGVPRRLARDWLERNGLTVLLDDLEVLLPQRTSWATRISGATGRSPYRHRHGRNATGRELPIGQRQVLAFSHRGDGVWLLEFADDLHSSHNVRRPQGSCAERTLRAGLGRPARRGWALKPSISSSFVRFVGEL